MYSLLTLRSTQPAGRKADDDRTFSRRIGYHRRRTAAGTPLRNDLLVACPTVNFVEEALRKLTFRLIDWLTQWYQRQAEMPSAFDTGWRVCARLQLQQSHHLHTRCAIRDSDSRRRTSQLPVATTSQFHWRGRHQNRRLLRRPHVHRTRVEYTC